MCVLCYIMYNIQVRLSRAHVYIYKFLETISLTNFSYYTPDQITRRQNQRNIYLLRADVWLQSVIRTSFFPIRQPIPQVQSRVARFGLFEAPQKMWRFLSIGCLRNFWEFIWVVGLFLVHWSLYIEKSEISSLLKQSLALFSYKHLATLELGEAAWK